MVETLIYKILSLTLIMALGFLLVKCRVLKSEDSKSLSKMSLHLITPCMILNAFQVEYTTEVKNGLFLAILAAAVIHVMLIILNAIFKRVLHMDPVEQTSVVYSNAGNLIIPLVTAMLGKEYVIYTSGYIVVQIILLWSHGRSVISGEKGISIRKVLLNINMIFVAIGILLFFTRIQLPALVQDTVDSIGSMIGPVAMLITGMLLGGMNFGKILSYKRVWLVAFLRLFLIPLITIPILKFTGLAQLVPNGETVLLVSLLAATTPAAATVTQLAQVYGKDAEYASAINVVTTLLCVVTIPLMVKLYQM